MIKQESFVEEQGVYEALLLPSVGVTCRLCWGPVTFALLREWVLCCCVELASAQQ